MRGLVDRKKAYRTAIALHSQGGPASLSGIRFPVCSQTTTKEPLITRAHSTRRARRVRGAARITAQVATGLGATICVAGMFAAAASIFWLHLSLQPVLSGSMRPTFAPGALLVTRPMPTSKVHPGDIVVFIPPGESARYAHRVTSVTSLDGRTVITTKGDANAAADKWHATLLGTSVPKVVTSVPYLGRVAVAMHGPLLRILIAAFAGIAVAVTAVRRFMPTIPNHRRPSPA